MKKILIPIASRSETVKAAPVIKHLKEEYTQQLATRWIHIGEHPNDVWQAGSLFGLVPNRQITTENGEDDLHTLTFQISRMVSDEFDEQRPDLVLLQGDSLQAVLSAQQAFIRRIPIVHIDAGRRANGNEIDYQQESNRRMLSALATFHCVTNAETANNLRHEGFPAYEIGITGNPIVDAAHLISRTGLISHRNRQSQDGVSLKNARILVIIQSPDTPRSRITEFSFAIATLAHQYPGLGFTVLTESEQRGERELSSVLQSLSQITFRSPLNYLGFAKAVTEHDLVLTDSSDVQFEATALGTPTLLMRSTTEEPELSRHRETRRIGCSQESIVDGVVQTLHPNGHFLKLCDEPNPLGDGKASARIGRLLANWSRNNILTPRAFEPFSTMQALPLRSDGTSRRYHTSF